MAERVGYDPETGLHLEEPPKQVPKHLLEEGSARLPPINAINVHTSHVLVIHERHF